MKWDGGICDLVDDLGVDAEEQVARGLLGVIGGASQRSLHHRSYPLLVWFGLVASSSSWMV